MADKLMQPFGVYDTVQCGLVHLGLYEDEASCWQVFLGWPDAEEIAAAKASGLLVLPVTALYQPPPVRRPMRDVIREDVLGFAPGT